MSMLSDINQNYAMDFMWNWLKSVTSNVYKNLLFRKNATDWLYMISL